MPYQQNIDDCLAESIGARGLSHDEFSGLLGECQPILENLRARHADGSLPLLRLPETTDDLDALEDVAHRHRRDFKDVVVLGTGGSSLGGQTLYSLADSGFGPKDGIPNLHFIDNVDPHTFESLFEMMDMRFTGFIVISKSGGTAETVAQFIVCLAAISAEVGEDVLAKHALVITEPQDNPLRRLAEERNLPILEHDPGIGGRFSALSLVGLLPAMIAGLDARAVRKGALQVLQQTLQATDPANSDAAVGAALQVGFARHHGVASTVLMPYADRLSNFGLWYMQLWAESLGKQGHGTTPIRAMGTRDQHSQMQLYLDGPQDKVFTLIMLDVASGGRAVCSEKICDDKLSYLRGRYMGDLLDAEQRATAATLVRHGCPTRVFTLTHLDEEILGGLLMHFMLETIIAAGLFGVDAFDQPAVEEGKALARDFLSRMDD